MDELILHSLRWVTIGLLVLWACGMYAQQTFARKLLAQGLKWAKSNVAGRFFGTMEGNYWLWFLVSLRWKSCPSRHVKIICLWWTVFDVILLGVLLALFAFFGFSAVTAR